MTTGEQTRQQSAGMDKEELWTRLVTIEALLRNADPEKALWVCELPLDNRRSPAKDAPSDPTEAWDEGWAKGFEEGEEQRLRLRERIAALQQALTEIDKTARYAAVDDAASPFEQPQHPCNRISKLAREALAGRKLTA